MNKRFLIRIIFWSLIFIICVSFGVYGLLLNNNQKPIEDTNNNPVPNNSVSDVDYFTTENLKDNIHKIDTGSYTDVKNNLKISIFGSENPVITISEKPQTTGDTYNSIVSAISVIFDNNSVSEYFKENYSSLTLGQKVFNGFKIEINPSLNSKEIRFFSTDDTNIVRVTITRSQINQI